MPGFFALLVACFSIDRRTVPQWIRPSTSIAKPSFVHSSVIVRR
jgi:hypothetical protein